MDLGPEARRVYKEVNDHFVSEVKSGVVNASNALVKVTRLLQIASGHVGVEDADTGKQRWVEQIDDSKTKACRDIIESIPPDEPVGVICRFVPNVLQVEALARHMSRPYAEVSGRRHDVRAVWKPEPGEILCISQMAGQTGFDCTACCNVIVYSCDAVPGNYEQVIGRFDRAGQQRSVSVSHLYARGTKDLGVYRSLESKQGVISQVLSGGSAG